MNRRTAIKGLGTAIALPWLEAFASAAPAAVAPKRAVFIYVPNGAVMPDWTPAATGPLGELPSLLKPLQAHKDYLNVLTGLTLDKARANGDGAGDHARSMSAFLTGRQPRKTHGADLRAGISADQHLANSIGTATRFDSLELGIERGGQAGNCDSGYSCAYSSNLSWRSDTTPNVKEVDPRLVFDRLFGSGKSSDRAEARARRDADNQSVLDFVMEDAKGLNKTLGQADRQKLDEYFEAVRDVEGRIARMRKEAATPKPAVSTDMPAPKAIPKEFSEHVRIMSDLLVLAFRSDLTRIVTFPFGNDGSNRSYKAIGVSEGHHEISHHGENADKIEKLRKINRHHLEQFAYLLDKLRGVKEGAGNLLDNSLIVYGSGIADGNRHNHDNLPILLAGKGGGAVETGRHLRFSKETPLMNLYLKMFEVMGAPSPRFGDSTGKLSL